jgi:hypothetical protein
MYLVRWMTIIQTLKFQHSYKERYCYVESRGIVRPVAEYDNRFDRFANVEAQDSSPLYETLSLGIAEDDELLTLAGNVPEDQPAPNLLFAAVQFLLFEDSDNELADYYPNISESTPSLTEGAYEAFRSFCLDHRENVISLLQSRRVQTNVISRCSILLPVFEYISQRCDRTPLGLVEIGPSAGLNLLWNEYGYEYSEYERYGNKSSPVQLSCDVRGDVKPPVPLETPPTGERLGIDLNPLRIEDDEDVRWLRALVWPEHAERRRLLENAVSVARASPPKLIEGDALTDLHRYHAREDIDATDPLVDLSDRRVRAIVKECAQRAAETTGDDDFQYVSSHDLRRRFAQRLLVDHSMNPRVVMAVGGWDSFQAIEPYLNAPSPEVVNDAFKTAGLA